VDPLKLVHAKTRRAYDLAARKVSLLKARHLAFWMTILLMIGACGQGGATTPGSLSPSGGAQSPLTLTYVANMGVLVSAGDTKVLVDALFNKPNPDYRAPAPETLDKIMKGEAPFDGVDLVLVTHDHPDHFDAGLAVRYLEAVPEAALLAPADAVEAMRGAAPDWARIGPRVTAVGLKVGEKQSLNIKGVAVTACRTLHSGDRDVPMNLMYLFELGGRGILHEGDPNGRCEIFQAFGHKDVRLDLAILHYWYPLEPNCARFLQEDLKADHIALSHLPIRLEGDAPSKIDMVRQHYKDIFLLLPGTPAKALAPAVLDRGRETLFGQAPPGPEPVKFWPGVLDVDRCPHGQLAFTPDGGGVFWSAILRPGPEQTIYVSSFDGKAFSKPVVAPFAATKGNGGPAFSPDGKRLFFNAELPPSAGSSAKRTAICYVERIASGWTQPVPIESTVDDRMTKGQVSVARNGNIYFTARVLTERAPGIFICRYTNGKYLAPEKLAGPLATLPLVLDPWVDPDEKFLLVSCPPQEGPPLRTDIGISFRQPDGSWGIPVRLGGAVNTEAFERFPSLSRDGKFLFFIRSLSEQFVGDQAYFYWIDAQILKAFKAAYSHLDWLGPDSWIRTVVRGLQAGKR
jgi:L-ascorbate metabolism protein UlaG (beta-lactamase superfamily)